MNIYISILILLIFLTYIITTLNKKRKARKHLENEEWQKRRQEEYDLLVINRKEARRKLYIEKKVKCDDGITRVYLGADYGIIKEYSEGIIINSLKVDNRQNDRPFNSKISNQKWFSDEGITLNTIEDIIEKNKKYNELRNDYQNRYRVRGTMINYADENSLIYINNFLFYGYGSVRIGGSFTGKVNGEIYENGIGISKKIKLKNMGILDKFKEDKKLLEYYKFDGIQSKLGLFIDIEAKGTMTFANGNVDCERHSLYVCALELVDEEWEHYENIEVWDEFLLYENKIILDYELLNDELGGEEEFNFNGNSSWVLESEGEWSTHKSQYIKMKNTDEIEIC